MGWRSGRSAARVSALALVAAAGVACSAAHPGPQRLRPPTPAARPAAPPASETAPSPARWMIVDRMGALFDQAGRGAPPPRAEPAIVDGVRVVLESGRIVAAARHADRFGGFRSLPARLGGGFLAWSDARVYRIAGKAPEDFLAEPSPLVDVTAVGGARAWLATVLLRTGDGVLEWDPAAASPSVRRLGVPGLADALALDAQRAVRLDLLGRASYTTDGGAHWIDVLATRGVRVRSLSEGAAGEIVLDVDRGSRLVLGPSGDLALPPPTPPDAPEPAPPGPASSRALPAELLAHAVAGGALLPGERILVTRTGGLQVIATRTGLPVADADLPSLDARFARCQAVPVEALPPVLACAGDEGAEVLSLEGSISRPAVEATFPAGGAGFLGGPRGRLVYDGRCGPEPASSRDLGPATRPPETTDSETATPAPDPVPAGPPELPPDDDARACSRAYPSHWVERRLRGDDARRLYRWIPGDDAAVTALVLSARAAPDDAGADGGAGEGSTAGDGVRVVRVDPQDPALAGGAFPAVPALPKDAPFRSVDVDFWLDQGGAIRGWVVLPGEGEEKVAAASSAQGPAHRLLPVSPRRGGRRAGVRIDEAGRVTLYPLPAGALQVVTGGRFALAMAGPEGDASKEDASPARRWFETTDGGETWIAVEGPPVGTLEPPPDDGGTFACSPAGCAWSSGIVRLGWGGSPPRSDPEPTVPRTAAIAPRRPDPPLITCHLEAEGASSPPAAVPIALGFAGTLVPTKVLGRSADHRWTADVLPPFQPAAGPRHLSVADARPAGTPGSVLPLLTTGARDSMDLLLVADGRRMRIGGGSPAFLPFSPAGRFAAAADVGGGAVAIFSADRGDLWLAKGEVISGALHLLRVTDPSYQLRLTLARRLAPGGGLALLGYSPVTGEVFAGDVDLGRAEVAPLAALGTLDVMGDAGACASPAYRAAIEMPVRIRIAGSAGEQRANAEVLVGAGAGRTCLLAVEAPLPGNVLLRATMDPGGMASRWSSTGTARGRCAIGTAP